MMGVVIDPHFSIEGKMNKTKDDTRYATWFATGNATWNATGNATWNATEIATEIAINQVLKDE